MQVVSKINSQRSSTATRPYPINDQPHERHWENDCASIFQAAHAQQMQRLNRIRAEMAELGADWI